MKIDIILTVDIDEEFINMKDPLQRMWLHNVVLNKDVLRLHSDEIGDQVGTIENVFVVEAVE